MEIRENLRLALEGLRANKMRALLTMLGIIIGIGSVIGILTVGNGLSGSITGQLSDLGANNIQVYLRGKGSAQEMMGLSVGAGSMEDGDLLSDEMFDALMARYPDEVASIAPIELAGSAQVKEGKLYANVSLYGVNASYIPTMNVELLAGRALRDKDIVGMRNVCVVSEKLVNNMFGGDIWAALGQEIQLYQKDSVFTYVIVGVSKYEASVMAGMMSTASEKDMSTELYLPITNAQRITGHTPGLHEMVIMSAVEGLDGRDVATHIENFLNRYYKNNDDFMVQAMSMESMMDMVSSVMGTLSIAISVIAGISLLVGGIGVMNILLVSVTERTREIGIRKALGATNGNIRFQFVTESVIICVVGGVLGILFGTGLGLLGSSLLGELCGPTLSSIFLAFGFSMAIGVFFGYYPANKAASLDPIDALRYE
ncbi:MAG: ABC transporter permease [Christensenellaceae bacterium]|nr:ABC transporter permease [Christensenellaceae bacterium]